MEEKIIVKNIKCKIIRSGRKTAAIEINGNADVLFRAPRKMSRGEIEKIITSHIDWIEKKLIQQNERKENILILSKEQEDVLRASAKSYIPGRVAYWSQIMGLQPTAVKITSAKKRFGSCSSKNSLCFSLMLMLYEQEAIDYVIVHELAHITHKNHSSNFYALVKKYYPDYKSAEAALKKPPRQMQ